MAKGVRRLAVLVLAAIVVGCSTNPIIHKLESSIPYAAAYGDSTTEGDGVDPADRWTTLLSEQTLWPIENYGANGALSEEIAARWGSVTPVGAPVGGFIPASMPVVLDLDINPIRSGLVDPTLTVDVRAGGSVVRGELSRSDGDDCTFTRATPGAAIPTERVEVRAVVPEHRRLGLLLVGMGINNEAALDSGKQTLDQIKGWYLGMTDLHRGRLIVWGMLDRGLSEAPGTKRGDYIAELEAWLSQQYGSDFLPVRQYLSSEQALVDAASLDPAFEPTSADLESVSAGSEPPSFRIGAGSVHLNELGHRLVAQLFFRHLSS